MEKLQIFRNNFIIAELKKEYNIIYRYINTYIVNINSRESYMKRQ